jgi:hypothetical protein
MGIFSKKVNSVEFESLTNKLIEIYGKISTLSSELEIMKTNLNSLRGLVNRKLNKEISQNTDSTESEVLYNRSSILPIG